MAAKTSSAIETADGSSVHQLAASGGAGTGYARKDHQDVKDSALPPNVKKVD